MRPISLTHRVCCILILLSCGFLSSCEKDEEDKAVAFETSTMMDIESNVYTTIKIGDQWWMAENLRVTTYRDGQPVIHSQLPLAWQDSGAAYCMFEDNPSAPGLLYNLDAVKSVNGLAPAGWHIATDEEWKKLEKFLGMSDADIGRSGWRGTNEGNKLKVPGITGWQKFEGNWPGNESGFSAQAGSCRLPDGTFGNPGLFGTGFWWTSSTASNGQAYYRYLDYKSAKIYRSADSYKYGFSVRCVKD